ncbi:MAG: hypothetical protein ACI97A_000900 [Planctomycetota bacterium]|jgi:hypothetical protein
MKDASNAVRLRSKKEKFVGIRYFRKLLWVILVSLSVSSCGGNITIHRLEFEESRPLNESVHVQIQNVPGNTTLRGWEKSKLEVLAIIRAHSDDRAAGVQISHQIEDGVLNVRVTWPDGGPKKGESCNLKVFLPPGGDAKIEGKDGFIKVLRMEGRLAVKGQNSAVEVINHEGDVTIENQGNHISCSEIQGRLQVRNKNGYIKVMGVQNDVDLETTNQKIELLCFPTFQGSVRCVTENQGIQVTLGRSQVGEFALKADGGKCMWDLGKRGKLLESISQSGATIVVGGSRATKSLIQTSGASVKLIVP